MIHMLRVNDTNLLGDVVADVIRDEPDMTAAHVAVSLDQAPETDVVLVSTGRPDNGAWKLTGEWRIHPGRSLHRYDQENPDRR